MSVLIVTPSTLLDFDDRRLHRLAQRLVDDVVGHRNELWNVVRARCLGHSRLPAPLLAEGLAGTEEESRGADLLGRRERAAVLVLDRGLPEADGVVLLHLRRHIVGDTVLTADKVIEYSALRHRRSSEGNVGKRGCS